MICAARRPSVWISARISSIVSGVAALAVDHHLQRLGVVHHRTERLSELMSNRGSQGGHRLAATGVGGEHQVFPAVDLGPLPCATLD